MKKVSFLTTEIGFREGFLPGSDKAYVDISAELDAGKEIDFRVVRRTADTQQEVTLHLTHEELTQLAKKIKEFSDAVNLEIYT